MNRLHHERKNFEMAKPPADSASVRVGVGKLCYSERNRIHLFNAPSKKLAYQRRRASSEQSGR
jgi:hypothetical protein